MYAREDIPLAGERVGLLRTEPLSDRHTGFMRVGTGSSDNDVGVCFDNNPLHYINHYRGLSISLLQLFYMYIMCIGFGTPNVELAWDDGHLTVFTTRPIRAREQLLLD
jgi:hypothetical protein